MHCPGCQREQSRYNALCAHCGAPLDGRSLVRPRWTLQRLRSSLGELSLAANLLPEPEGRSWSEVLPQTLLLLALALGTLPVLFSGKVESSLVERWLHLPNLAFHEAGHVFFSPFGQFIGSLGGTLGQFIIPLLCFWVFWVKQGDHFAAAVAFWWVAENFVDIAPYINDARAGELPLVGGNIGKHAPYGFHDWEYLLTETGLIEYDHAIAAASNLIGCLLMLLALTWMALILRQWCRS